MAEERLLVIEDEEMIRNLMGEYLEGIGFHVLKAENGRIGLEMFQSESPDLILVDLRMPEVDGLDVLEAVTRESPETPVIVVSGMGVFECAIEALRLGAWDYVTKPIFDLAVLGHAVCKALERARLLRENRSYREYLEEEVKKRTEKLERRTMELTVSNKRLEEEITERKRVEEELERLKYQNEMILNSAGEGILGINTQGTTIFVNPSAAKMLGRNIDDLVGRLHHEFVRYGKYGEPPYSPDQSPIYAAIKRGSAYRSEDEVLWKQDNTSIPIEYVISPIVENGNTAGVVVVLKDITERKNAERQLRKSLEDLRTSLNQTANALAATTEKKDPYTAGHQQRVSRIACEIAKEMGISQDRIDGIRMASILHDIGKIYVPAEFLSKPSELNEMEMTIMKTHPVVGYDILKNIKFPWPIAEIVVQHHERLNGSGYPKGLSNGNILLEARIIAVADVVEAMSTHRPYRPSLGLKAALEEISRGRGSLYDPDVVDSCLKVFSNKNFDL